MQRMMAVFQQRLAGDVDVANRGAFGGEHDMTQQ